MICRGEISKKLLSILKGALFLFLTGFLWVFFSPFHVVGQERAVNEYRFGYHSFYDPETLEPVVMEGFPTPILTPELGKRLSTWRNKNGVPWTTWAYEKTLNARTKQAHTVRMEIGSRLSNRETTKKIEAFLWEEYQKEGKKEEIEHKMELTYDFHLTQWFRENLSLSSFGLFSAIGEAFAYYTSPDYQKGTLPQKIEMIFEDMAQGKVELVYPKEEEGRQLRNQYLKILEKVRSEEYLNLESEGLYAGPDVLAFLQVQDQVSIWFDDLLNFINDTYAFCSGNLSISNFNHLLETNYNDLVHGKAPGMPRAFQEAINESILFPFKVIKEQNISKFEKNYCEESIPNTYLRVNLLSLYLETITWGEALGIDFVFPLGNFYKWINKNTNEPAE